LPWPVLPLPFLRPADSFADSGLVEQRGADRPLAHRQVVLDQVELAALPLGQPAEVRLLGVGHLDGALAGRGVDLELHEGGRHAGTVRPGGVSAALGARAPRRQAG